MALDNQTATRNPSISASQYGVAPVAGISIGKGRYTLSYRHYFLARESQSADNPALWNDANTLEIKVRF